jgi:4-diphosphocytidyl-2-C-methyl-D-erythritol kinase
MSEPQIFPAPAKLNLMLRVVGRRPDGYHLLQSVIRFLDHGDSLAFRVREDGLITRANSIDGVTAEEDLTLKAARLLQATAGTRLGVEIALHKRLPVGGGLGGGSSDAATTLLALNRLWGLDLTRQRLLALALQLGADVPVFIYGESALVEGIGEQLSPIVVPADWYLVLEPPVAVPTARIFAHKQLKRDSKPTKITAFSAAQAGNDLEAVVCAEYPEVARHLEWLKGKLKGAAQAWVTGTGACVFAAFPSERAARQVWDESPSGMRGFIARGLERHPLHGLAH